MLRRRKLSAAAAIEHLVLAEEGHRLLAFAAADAETHEVRVAGT